MGLATAGLLNTMLLLGRGLSQRVCRDESVGYLLPFYRDLACLISFKRKSAKPFYRQALIPNILSYDVGAEALEKYWTGGLEDEKKIVSSISLSLHSGTRLLPSIVRSLTMPSIMGNE